MVETNKESFIEVVCSELNERKIHENKLDKSPELKVQIFLNKNPAQNYISGLVSKSNSTLITCEKYRELNGLCDYSKKPCKYNELRLKE